MEISIINKGTYNQYGDFVEGSKTVGLSAADMKALQECVKSSGVSKEEIESLIQALKDINISQNDLTTEFAKFSSEQQASRNTSFAKKLQDRVTLTNGLVTLGKTAVGIATGQPALALPEILNAAKDLVQ